jgi:hypothetical protein
MGSMYDVEGTFEAFLIAALIVAIVLYFTFMCRSNEGKLTGFSDWMYRFLHFKTLFIEALCKISFIASSVYIILIGFYVLFAGSMVGLLVIIFGPLVVRVIYEFALILVIICKNTSDISNRLCKQNEKQATQQQAAQQQATPDYSQQYAGYDNQQYTQYGGYENQQNYQSTTRYCINCGAQLADGDVYCKNCGQQN